MPDSCILLTFVSCRFIVTKPTSLANDCRWLRISCQSYIPWEDTSMRLLAKCVAGCFSLGILGLAYLGSTSAAAQDKKKKVELKVKVGDTAPAFESVDENGKTFKS